MALDSLQVYSDQLAAAVEKMTQATVRIEAQPRGAGSGIVWKADGIILTANHVVGRSEEARVQVDGRGYTASVIGRDSATDIALLRIEATGLARADVGDSKGLKVGHRVFAVGRPWDEEAIVRAGVVSALGRAGSGNRGDMPGDRFGDRLIHTDVRLYPGFSGGPLANAAGRVVGINTAVVGGDMGLAVPSETVGPVAAQLLEAGRVKRGHLGVAVQKIPLNQALARRLSLEQETGLMILSVEGGSSAERAGLLPGDILVGMDGTGLARVRELYSWLASQSDGQETAARVIRGGELEKVPLAVELR